MPFRGSATPNGKCHEFFFETFPVSLFCDSCSLTVEDINSNLLEVVDSKRGQTYRPLFMKDRFLYFCNISSQVGSGMFSHHCSSSHTDIDRRQGDCAFQSFVFCTNIGEDFV